MIDGLSERLKERRAKCGYSRKFVADYISISASTLADYENGYGEPSTKVLMKLSKIYRCSTDYLLGLEKPDDAVLLDATGLAPEQVEVLERLLQVMRGK